MDDSALPQKRPPAGILFALALAAIAILFAIQSGNSVTMPGTEATPSQAAITGNIDPAAARTPVDYTEVLANAQRLNDDPFPVHTLASDGDRLWVGSDLQGLYLLDGDDLVRVHDGLIYSLLPERNDHILAGYGSFPGQEPVSEIRDDAGGVVFLSRPIYLSGECEAGLGRWDGDRWASLWTQEAVWDLARDDNALFLSTNDGVYLFQGGQARHLGLAKTLCFSLFYDQATDTLYAGARNGIWHRANDLWYHDLELPDHKVLDFAQGEEGTLYAATTAGLYVSADGATWRRIGEEQSLTALTVAPSKIYAGGDGGILAIEGTELINVATHPEVRALAWHQGHLYAGTNAGLWRVNIP